MYCDEIDLICVDPGKRISVDHPPCKSGLVLLCEQFTQRFGQLTADGAPRSLPLNEVAAALSVPRRRLYDILNVLEAVEVLSSFENTA